MNHEKLQTLREVLTAEQLDGIWISNPENIYYLTGFLSDPHERLLALLVMPGALTLFVPKMEVAAAEQAFSGEIIGYLDTENPYLIKSFNLQSIGIESEHLTVARLTQLEEYFDVQKTTAIDQTVKEMRNIKTADEITILKQAAKFADDAVKIGVDSLKEGISETEVIRIIENKMLSIDGITAMSFDTMVLFGDNAANPHGTPGNRTLKQGEYVLFDLGVVFKGYCSDITRTVAFGETQERHDQVHAIVTEANRRATALVKPGAKISDIDAAARDYITEAGYGEEFPHRLGHGLGISVHEFPDISSSNEDTLKEGMVFTIEPGIYVNGEVGVRVEDDILVTADGYEVLTHYVK
ncbi:aminopeptidase P family protein [Macrococcus hajekii]|uniref:Aminopeptidase P family protein n=1 Tax=Macrococcus hajekii TaxID=198482 RepID=A0A4R6BLW3_9STAP|nr:Xaa-Pro peptidase family protein [Macrococcus hajekii]TDM02698.1 aminopeptidase P family protein [Macrococcus hajekii]GGB03146.1 putative peptidase [Macrococcus hajekii]